MTNANLTTTQRSTIYRDAQVKFHPTTIAVETPVGMYAEFTFCGECLYSNIDEDSAAFEVLFKKATDAMKACD